MKNHMSNAWALGNLALAVQILAFLQRFIEIDFVNFWK